MVSLLIGSSLEHAPNKSATKIVTLPNRIISKAKVEKMQKIEDNITRIHSELQQSNAQLIVVSKYRSVEDIESVYQTGQRKFAENRVQPLLERFESLPKDIEWHLIGHLQTNKVKYIAPFIKFIHSVDSLKLAQEINKQALKHNRQIDVLLQTHVAQEESKFGVPPIEFENFVDSLMKSPFEGIRFRGIMGMASFTSNSQQVNHEFELIHTLFKQIKHRFFENDALFNELSIGMSGDYQHALKHGATMVRIGSAIFE